MNDIFISYCHDDDQKLGNEKLGWVENFQDTLKKRLAAYAGRAHLPSVFWDNRDIRFNNMLDETIQRALRDAVVLVSVLSPSYISSDWCHRELEFFRNAAGSSRYGSLRADGDTVSRIVKVIKLRIDDDSSLAEIPELQNCTGLSFYRERNGFVAEIAPQSDPNDWPTFLDLVNQLAQVLLKTLGIFDKRTRSGLTIYLADCSLDLCNDRELLARELDAWGHTVVREAAHESPCDLQTYRERVRQNLRECHLSIHPIGTTYGTRPDGWDGKSTIAVQYGVAADEARRAGREIALTCLPWMKSDVQLEKAEDQAFVRAIEGDAALLKDTLEGLKTRVRDLLAPLLQPKPSATTPSAPKSASAPADKPNVYVVCDQNDDAEKIRELETLLAPRYAVTHSLIRSEVQELAAKYPADELDRRVRKDHLDNLDACDAALIYYGEGDVLWLREKLRDLSNVNALRRENPLRARAVFLASTDNKSYVNPDLLVLRGFDDPTLALAPFDAAMQAPQQKAV